MQIDELIVVLGLDPRKFTEGQREAVSAFRKLKDESHSFGQQFEKHAAGVANVFRFLKTGLIGLATGFAGYEMMRVVNHINDMDAATSRFSRTIGVSVPVLALWQGMVERVGGEPGAARSTLGTLQQTLENIRAGIEMPDKNLAFMAGQAGFNLMGRGNSEQLVRSLQRFFAGEIGAGRMTTETAASRLALIPGMNQSMIDLLLSDFQKIEEEVKKVTNVTGDAGAEAEKYLSAQKQLQQSFTALTRLMTIQISPWLVKLFDSIANFIRDLSNGDIAPAESWLGKLLGSTSHRKSEAIAPATSGGGGGGTRGDRNNNPGNIKFGQFALAHGAIGSDGAFAIFPDWNTGAAAQAALLQTQGYQGLTLDQFGNRYSEGNAAWKATVGAALGIGLNDIVDTKDPRLIDAIRRAEGTGGRGAAGARGGMNRSTTNNHSSEVNINKIEVNTSATDAGGIAKDIGGAVKRQSLLQGANYSLTG
jgi:hypothetical protein